MARHWLSNNTASHELQHLLTGIPDSKDWKGVMSYDYFMFTDALRNGHQFQKTLYKITKGKESKTVPVRQARQISVILAAIIICAIAFRHGGTGYNYRNLFIERAPLGMSHAEASKLIRWDETQDSYKYISVSEKDRVTEICGESLSLDGVTYSVGDPIQKMVSALGGPNTTPPSDNCLVWSDHQRVWIRVTYSGDRKTGSASSFAIGYWPPPWSSRHE